ncbi:MAG: RNA polymerase sigma factor [Clostridia bacterium]|nr:RNA polymerase sigma factor [Clostridia bacterium]
MDDVKIINLFFARDEKAINETQNKYGEFIHFIAFNIMEKNEDAEECVNDTYLKLWNSIPPERPLSFKAYIGRITRNSALSRYRYNKAEKRDCGIYVLLSELEECLPDNTSVENEYDGKLLSEIISVWLKTLSPDNRAVFIKRYWYGESVKDLAEKMGVAPSKLSSLLFSLRKQLKKELERKGVTV